MPTYQYTAIDAAGKPVSGKVDAPSEAAAKSKLAGQKLMATSLKAKETSAAALLDAAKGKKSGKKTGKVGHEVLTVFTRQLSTLLQAGLPLLRALEILHKQEKNPNMKAILASLCENVSSGNNLSDAMTQHSKAFDYLYTNMIRAGEAGGVLDKVLDRLAMFMEKSLRLKKKIKAAMIYPIVVITVAIGIVILLMIAVVPKFKEMLAKNGAAMPKLTEIVIAISEFIQAYWFLIPIIIALIYAGVLLVSRNQKVKRVYDRFVFRVPKVGAFVTVASVARFARTFGTLMASGVPILQAITITRDTMSNSVINNALTTVHDRVRDGEPLSAPIEQSNVYPAMVTSMIQVGEETGQLPEMLNRVADTYDEEVDNAVGAMTSIIEPLLIVFLALVVGTIVIAMFLPLITLIETMMQK